MKLSLAQLGLGIQSFFKGTKKARVSPATRDRELFEESVKDQLLKLKEKGISIPIFTL